MHPDIILTIKKDTSKKTYGFYFEEDNQVVWMGDGYESPEAVQAELKTLKYLIDNATTKIIP